ncbi:MAG: glycosyltransferase [Candidatus Taylorbacteria bacterium]|nr:glycosyltransferase [Candidatus Taylorbacteria bacterium]
MTALYYIANMRFPTERAHGIQVAKMCEAFAQRHGTDTEKINVTLLVPDRKTMEEDPFVYYGIERIFTIERIPVPDIVRFGKLGFLIESFLFALRATRRALQERDAIIYTREELPLLLMSPRRAFYEVHQLRRSFIFTHSIKKAKGVISITQGLKDALVRTGVPKERILVAHDGYDAKQFGVLVTKTEARARLSLSPDKRIAVYIGGFEEWKGVETLCKASEFLRSDNIQIAVIGGTAKEKETYERKYPLVTFLGARPYADLPRNQQIADVLVIPNSGQERISREFTSPLKLFAHMASGVPIVASKLPSLTEVLSERNAYIVEPDDPKALADAIKETLRSPQASTARARQAKEDARTYTWSNRAGNVLAYIYGN